jgi:hypothetical protein
MGCNCKDDNPSKVNQETGELNLMGNLLKVPSAIGMTLLIMLLSPFLIILIWVIAMRSAFGKDSNIINMLLFKFQKKEPINEEVDDSDFNEDDYEIVGDIEIIK